jgi:hypothetical protein
VAERVVRDVGRKIGDGADRRGGRDITSRAGRFRSPDHRQITPQETLGRIRPACPRKVCEAAAGA